MTDGVDIREQVVADGNLDDAGRADMQRWTGCTAFASVSAVRIACASLLLLGSISCESADSASSSASKKSELAPAVLSSPGPRDGHDLVFLKESGEVALLNGSDTDAGVWGWDGESWRRPLPVVPAPTPRRLSGVAVVGGGTEVMLYGGIGPTGPSAETWTYDGANWRQHAVPAPTPTDHVAMAYDPVRKETVLFGGRGRGGVALGETWVWDGRTWAKRATTGPAARIHHTMAWDPATKTILLVGGQQADDMWSWNGRTWTRIAPPGPAPHLIAARMTYVDTLRRVVLTGGAQPDGTLSEQTWTWNGRRWEVLKSASPPGRIGHAVAYDAERAALVLYGGFADEQQLTDLWELRASRWVRVVR